MHIEKIISQHRRDFTAVFKCEHCGDSYTGQGYDDDYFHRTVVGNLACKKCGKKAGADFRPLGTKYAAHEVV